MVISIQAGAEFPALLSRADENSEQLMIPHGSSMSAEEPLHLL